MLEISRCNSLINSLFHFRNVSVLHSRKALASSIATALQRMKQIQKTGASNVSRKLKKTLGPNGKVRVLYF